MREAPRRRWRARDQTGRTKVHAGVEIANTMTGFYLVFDGAFYAVPFGSFDGALAGATGPHAAFYRREASKPYSDEAR